MTNSKQSAKRLRTSERQRLQNKAIRTAMRTAMKGVLKAESPDKGKSALVQAMKRIDKAAKSNVIHKNAAARFKSRLAKRVAKLA
jgi:small subunit ribosomal protein S20